MYNGRITHTLHPHITPEQARAARARAWAYVFECFNRRNGNEAAPASRPDDAERRSSELGAKTSIP
jgi:hypothetical protein